MVKLINKYRHYLIAHWQQALIYRAESLLWVFIDATPLLAMILLWVGVYRYGGTLLHLSLTSLITYYLIGFFLSRFTDTHFEEAGVDQILDGTIARFFLKPISLYSTLVIGEIAWKFMGIFLSLGPLFILISFFFPAWILTLNLAQLLILMTFIVLGFILDSLISFIIVTIAFYTDQGRSLSHAKWMVMSMFNGSLLPIAAYPPWLKTIAQFLPFQYIFAVPAQVYQGVISPTLALRFVFNEILWIGAFALVARFLWHRAKLKFTAVGS